MLRGFDNATEAIELIDRAIEWFGPAGKDLAKWKTDSLAVIQHPRRGHPAGLRLPRGRRHSKSSGDTTVCSHSQLTSLAHEALDLSRRSSRPPSSIQ